jgi:hypothetical protein
MDMTTLADETESQLERSTHSSTETRSNTNSFVDGAAFGLAGYESPNSATEWVHSSPLEGASSGTTEAATKHPSTPFASSHLSAFGYVTIRSAPQQPVIPHATTAQQSLYSSVTTSGRCLCYCSCHMTIHATACCFEHAVPGPIWDDAGTRCHCATPAARRPPMGSRDVREAGCEQHSAFPAL